MTSTLAELGKLLPPRIARWAPQLLAAELCYGVEPYWLAAIIDQESLGGVALTPPGPAGTGDGGHGHGLGQIDDRTHAPFLVAAFDDGVPLWKDPTFNILYAARLLRRNLDGCAGDYLVAVAAYNAGLRRAKNAVEPLGSTSTPDQRRLALDPVTTRGSYVSSVSKRRHEFLHP